MIVDHERTALTALTFDPVHGPENVWRASTYRRLPPIRAA